jgi:hypothetical protein
VQLVLEGFDGTNHLGFGGLLDVSDAHRQTSMLRIAVHEPFGRPCGLMAALFQT